MTRLLLLIVALFGLATAAPAQDRADGTARSRRSGSPATSIMSARPASPPIWSRIRPAMSSSTAPWRESADQIAANIRTLGFRVEDVRILLQTHAHWDHVGGLAALKRVVRRAPARQRGRPGDARNRANGPIATMSAPSRRSRSTARSATARAIRLGGTAITAHLTPGHTKGGTSYTLTVTEHGRRLDVLIACSLTVANQRLVGDRLYPDAARDFEATFARLAALRADIFLGGHTGSFGFEEKRARLVGRRCPCLRRPRRARGPARPRPRRLCGGAGPPARRRSLACRPPHPGRKRGVMKIRAARPDDAPAIWGILEPVIRAGETWALPRDMSEDEAWAYWTAPDREAFVAEADGRILGTYFLRANHLGGGGHVANTGYMTAADAAGRGVGRRMCLDSLDRARARGFAAMQFNFVVSSNERAVRLWHRLGFATVGRLPGAFRHPRLGDVDVLVMYQRL